MSCYSDACTEDATMVVSDYWGDVGASCTRHLGSLVSASIEHRRDATGDQGSGVEVRSVVQIRA